MLTSTLELHFFMLASSRGLSRLCSLSLRSEEEKKSLVSISHHSLLETCMHYMYWYVNPIPICVDIRIGFALVECAVPIYLLLRCSSRSVACTSARGGVGVPLHGITG